MSASVSEKAASIAPRARMLVIAPHGSYRTAPFLAAARRLEVDVLIASQGEHSIVSAYADGLHIDLRDPDAALRKILTEAKARPFAGIIGTDDATTELAAAAARALRLPHNPPEAARIARRKDLARAHLQAAGAPVPQHWRIDLRAALAPQAESVRYPCVLKPIAMSASRGVIRVDNPREFLRACARIGRIVAEEEGADERCYLLAEEFVPGFEVAVEGMLRDGRLDMLAIFDKPDPLDGPYFEETYYVTPSRLDAEAQERLRACLSEACAIYGLRTGPIHAECRINARGVWILEVAARTIGGLCARLLQFGTGYGLEELVLAEALGQPLAPPNIEGGVGVLMIPIPRRGILRRVEGILAASRVPHIEDVIIQVREGYELVPLPEGSSYLGFIYARAPTPAAVEAALRSAHACLNIVVAPLWKAEVNATRVSKGMP
jgi:biotin carboxylase